MAMTLSKVTIWELPGNMLCRVQWPLHLANITGLPSATGQALGKGRHFAECLLGDTRQSGHLCRVSKSMALGKAGTFVECLTLTLGKATVTDTFICRVSDWHSAKPLLSVTLGKGRSVNSLSAKTSLPSALYRALGKAFAEC